jgi:hypothetical protein
MKNVHTSYKIFLEMLSLDPNLLAIFSHLVNLWVDGTIEITSVHRTREQNKRAGAKTLIHVVGPPYRAMDISIRTLTGGQEKAQAICDLLNDLWAYDPFRPDKPVAYCKPHGTGPHIHIQVHPNTRLKAAA